MEAVSPIFGLRLWLGGRDYLLLGRRESILFWPCCIKLLIQHFPVMIFQPPWRTKTKRQWSNISDIRDLKSVCVTHSFGTFLGIQGAFHYVTFLSHRIVKDRSVFYCMVTSVFVVPGMCNICRKSVLNNKKKKAIMCFIRKA